MSEMKFKGTPGVWMLPHFVRDDVKCNCTTILSEKQSFMGGIADILYSLPEQDWREGDHAPIEEAKYNALLISKAPEMLQKLKDILAVKIVRKDEHEEIEELLEFIKSCVEL